MIREFFRALRDLPPAETTDVLRLLEESEHAFDLFIDFLRSSDTFSHVTINALITLCWRLIGSKKIPMVLDPFEGKLASLHFLYFQKKLVGTPLFIMPYGYLDLVRTDQVMQLCAVVSMASQGCDYYSRRLDPVRSPQRAQAYEAELLLALRPLVIAENLPWELNDYLQQVLRLYPDGLASLPTGSWYEPPIYS